MSSFLLRLIVCSLVLIPFTGLLLIIKRIFHKKLSADIQYALWSLFFVILAFPFFPANFTIQLPALPFHASLGPNASANTLFRSNTASRTISLSTEKIKDFAVSSSPSGSFSFEDLFLVVWVAGVFIMLIAAVRSWLLFRRLQASAMPVQNQQVLEIFHSCCRELSIKKKIPFYSTAFLNSPICAGIFQPKIYFPIRLISDGSKQDLRFMLLHELAHCRQRDHFCHLFFNLARIFYWFHPLVWFALREIRCDREIACDSVVLRLLTSKERKSYGNTLIQFAQNLSMFSFAAGIGSPVKQLKRRIINIAAFESTTNQKKLFGFMIYSFVFLVFVGCTPLLSISASEDNDMDYDSESNIDSESLDLSEEMKGYEGSFVLYDEQKDQWKIYQEEKAHQRISPASTYKIYDALFALESGIITPEDSHIAWNGTSYPFEEWEQDQTLQTAMKSSVNWYFQDLDAHIGRSKLQTYLKKIHYGNQSIGTDLSSYWLDGELKISPMEQVNLMIALHHNDFGFHEKNLYAVKQSLALSASGQTALYGKTGTIMEEGKNTSGWFVGYVEVSGHTYYFAANIQGKNHASGSQAAKITETVLAKLIPSLS
nr:BlaR1 family beta-lactam sensor/signal transducer [uncultured Anaerostipes sp.]